MTLQGRLSRLPLIDNSVHPDDLIEKINCFFGANLTDITLKSQLYEGRNGGTNEHYLHLERGMKKLVVKYID